MKLRLQVDRDDLAEGPFEPVGTPERVASSPSGGLDVAHFVDPISVLVVVSAAALAERLVTHWLRDREQGVQIDLTQDPPEVSRLAGVPRGNVVVISADGVEVHTLEYDGEQSLAATLQAVLEGAGG